MKRKPNLRGVFIPIPPSPFYYWWIEIVCEMSLEDIVETGWETAEDLRTRLY